MLNTSEKVFQAELQTRLRIETETGVVAREFQMTSNAVSLPVPSFSSDNNIK